MTQFHIPHRGGFRWDTEMPFICGKQAKKNCFSRHEQNRTFCLKRYLVAHMTPRNQFKSENNEFIFQRAHFLVRAPQHLLGFRNTRETQDESGLKFLNFRSKFAHSFLCKKLCKVMRLQFLE